MPQKIHTKSLARIAAIQVLYQLYHIQNQSKDLDVILRQIIALYKDPSINADHGMNQDIQLKLNISHLKQLVTYACDDLVLIDQTIQQNLTKEWQLNQLSLLLLAILRIAICEIKYFPEIPSKVLINEYTSIAGAMLADLSEVGFINSILDNFIKHASNTNLG